jgi:hypothetical protein
MDNAIAMAIALMFITHSLIAISDVKIFRHEQPHKASAPGMFQHAGLSTRHADSQSLATSTATAAKSLS